jgi:hypothetical protein
MLKINVVFLLEVITMAKNYLRQAFEAGEFIHTAELVLGRDYTPCQKLNNLLRMPQRPRMESR